MIILKTLKEIGKNKIMKEREIRQLSKLQKKFEDRCEQVVKILSKMDRYCRTGFEFVYHYIMGEDCVTCMGNDIDGDNEAYTEYFDAKLLYASDEEIEKYVEEEINKAIEKAKAQQAERYKAQEMQDRKTFENLKKRYGWK
jgi:hypothetical protein